MRLHPKVTLLSLAAPEASCECWSAPQGWGVTVMAVWLCVLMGAGEGNAAPAGA